MTWLISETLIVNVFVSICAAFAAHHFMLQYIPIFLQRKLFGFDMCKVRHRWTSLGCTKVKLDWIFQKDKEKTQIAEPIGVVAAAVYLISVFAFIPVPFYGWLSGGIEAVAEIENGRAEHAQFWCGK